MLEYPSVPPGSLNRLVLSMFIQIFHSDGSGTRNDRGETGQTKAAFVEINRIIPRESDLRIDDHVERHSLPLLFGNLLRRQPFQQLLSIFDYCKLQR